jgi:hypothetical protein
MEIANTHLQVHANKLFSFFLSHIDGGACLLCAVKVGLLYNQINNIIGLTHALLKFQAILEIEGCI